MDVRSTFFWIWLFENWSYREVHRAIFCCFSQGISWELSQKCRIQDVNWYPYGIQASLVASFLTVPHFLTPRALLDILRCTGQILQQRLVWSLKCGTESEKSWVSYLYSALISVQHKQISYVGFIMLETARKTNNLDAKRSLMLLSSYYPVDDNHSSIS